MPRLSLTMKEGTVGTWYKSEGETVEKGEPIVEVFSEKATHEVEAPASGILKKIIVQEGVEVQVNSVLAWITEHGEELSETEIIVEKPEVMGEVETKVLASPAAKRLAREYNIDLTLVVGSGPNKRIVEEDVERFAQERMGLLPKIKEVIPLKGYRKTSAERISRSFRTAPHSTVVMEVNVSNAKTVHDERKVSYTAILVKAVSKGLLEHPLMNSTLVNDEIRIYDDINVGVAVNTQHGLVVPVIRQADKKTFEEIGDTINLLGEKAKEGKLTKDDLSGGTFTITNLGMYGVDFFMPIINPPEAAILAVGRIMSKPVVVEGRIETKPSMMLSLSYDHRIVDGASAASFLSKIKMLMEAIDY
ncbi:MAG: dihydrolipoamide acetyltransferase family protein [Candidatus Bathyarchaeota archaeon]|jgi:pyruvate dehydrogenase E2 component (dihydrolipoamide acetyltransferase)